MRKDFEVEHYIRNLFLFVSKKLKEVCVRRKVLLMSVVVVVVTLGPLFMVETACAGKHHKHHHHYYSESEQYIEREKATSIAYSHAGVSSSYMVKYDIKVKSL
jgi:hypothetical protein